MFNFLIQHLEHDLGVKFEQQVKLPLKSEGCEQNAKLYIFLLV